MFFDLMVLIGILIMYFTYAKSVKYKEGSIEYLTQFDYCDFGFYLALTGIILKWIF